MLISLRFERFDDERELAGGDLEYFMRSRANTLGCGEVDCVFERVVLQPDEIQVGFVSCVQFLLRIRLKAFLP